MSASRHRPEQAGDGAPHDGAPERAGAPQDGDDEVRPAPADPADAPAEPGEPLNPA